MEAHSDNVQLKIFFPSLYNWLHVKIPHTPFCKLPAHSSNSSYFCVQFIFIDYQIRTLTHSAISDTSPKHFFFASNFIPRKTVHWEVYFPVPKSPYEIVKVDTYYFKDTALMCCISVWKNRSHTHLCFRSALGPPGLPVPGAAQSGVPACPPRSCTRHLRFLCTTASYFWPLYFQVSIFISKAVFNSQSFDS